MKVIVEKNKKKEYNKTKIKLNKLLFVLQEKKQKYISWKKNVC